MVLKCLNNDTNVKVLVVILEILDMIFIIVGVQFGIVRQLCEECASYMETNSAWFFLQQVQTLQ